MMDGPFLNNSLLKKRNYENIVKRKYLEEQKFAQIANVSKEV